MVFAILLLMAALSLLALKLSGKLNRMALELAVVIVLAGVAGYVWQGSPNYSSSPVEPEIHRLKASIKVEVVRALIHLRLSFEKP
jgi:uncharacterized membrane protein YqjE